LGVVVRFQLSASCRVGEPSKVRLCGGGVSALREAEATFPGKNGRIAYSGHDGNDYEIYTINPNGGMPSRLTNNKWNDLYPSYSPNGKRIAYTSYTDSDDREIYTIKVGGGGNSRATDPAYSAIKPSWGSRP
jgi:Tol biopolymer transport system component